MASTRYRNLLKSWAPFAGSNGGPALVDKGGAATNLGLCEGDCDGDSDCQGTLRCFQRGSSSETVPGCTPGGAGDVGDHDYCSSSKQPKPVYVGCQFMLCRRLAALLSVVYYPAPPSTTGCFPITSLGGGEEGLHVCSHLHIPDTHRADLTLSRLAVLT